MDSKEFSKIRCQLEMTQNQLSRVLCVSPKAIQSFEQGWRDVPTHVEREILLLLSLRQGIYPMRNRRSNGISVKIKQPLSQNRRPIYIIKIFNIMYKTLNQNQKKQGSKGKKVWRF